MKNKKSKKKAVKEKLKIARNQAALVAITRNSAGPMKDRRKKRKGRKSWKKDMEKEWGKEY